MRRHRTPGRRRSDRGRAAVTAALAALVTAAGLAPAHAVPLKPPSTTQARYSSGRSAPVTQGGHTAQQSDLPRLADGYGPSGAQRQAMEAAAAKARKTGKAVAVGSLMTPVQQVTAAPRGGFVLSSNPEPVRTKLHGSWIPVGMALHRDSDGRLSPAATAYGSVSFSGGGHTPLVTTRYEGVDMAVTWPGALPAPVIQGDSATYRSVLPSVDLVVSATSSGGFTDTLVVKSPAAARNPALATVRLRTEVSGGRLARGTAGNLAVLDSHGHDLMDAATPLMWDSDKTLPAKDRTPRGAGIGPDSSDAAHPGLAARVAAVRSKVSGSALSLVPDAHLLTAHSTVFPVYMDPTFNWHPNDPAAPAFDEVKQGCPGTSFYNQSGSLADNGYLGVGYNGWQEGSCYTGREHAIYQWKLSSTLWGAHINSATVDATEIYSAACASSYTVNLHWSGGIGSGTDWSNRPGYNNYSTSASYARAYNATFCPSNGSVTHGLNVYTPISHNASSHASTFTATLSEDSAESNHDDGGFSRFSHNPSLEIFYNLKPAAPTASTMSAVSGSDDAACDTIAPYPYMGKTIATTTPVLKAKVSDPDGDKLQATFQYWADGSTTKYTGLSGDNLNSGSYATYSLPSTFISSLTGGQIVDWQAKVTDGEDTTAYTQSPTCHFTAEPTAPDAPTVTSENGLYPNTDQNDGVVGAAAGTTGKFDIAGAGTTATKFVYHLDVSPATVSPPASQVVPASGNAATVSVTPPSPGPHTLYVYAIDGAGDVSGDFAYPFLAAGHAPTTCSSLTTCFDNIGISSDSNMGQADLDGSGNSLSATDLSNAGWTSGGKMTIDGAPLTLPAFGAGQKDNVLAGNQTIAYGGSGNALVFAGTSTGSGMSSPGAIDSDHTAPYVPSGTSITGSYCFSGTDPAQACPGSGTVTYTDGTSIPYYLTVPDWTANVNSLAAVVLPHKNAATGQVTASRRLYAFSVPLDATKTIASVTLPDISTGTGPHEQALHIFAMGTRNTTTGTPEASGSYAASASGQSWTGAWANPNEGNYNLLSSNFSNQSFRIALKPSLSGGTVRIKLDNGLGTSKLSIGHATIALSSNATSPSAVPTAAPVTLKFGGSQSVTVPEGGMVYSDPISFSVTANRYLLLSYDLTNSVPYLVQHSYANGSYEYISTVGSGDLTTDTTGTPFTTNAAAYGSFTDLVTNLDVSSAGVPTEAVLGDNLTDPFQPDTTLPNSNGYRVSDALTADEPSTPTPYGEIAEGIESNQLMTDNPETYNGSAIGGPAALSRIDRDILDQPGIQTVIVNEGLEDLLAGGTSDDLEGNGYTTLVQQLQAWGINVVLTSLTPCDGFTGDGATPNDPCTSTVDGYRTDVNAFLSGMNLGNPWATPAVYFADFDAAVAVTDTSNGEEKLAPAADGGDHVNLAIPAFGALTTALLSPQDTWNFDDGTGMPVANDTAATDSLNTLNANQANPDVGNSPLTLNGGTTWATDSTRGTVLALDGTSGNASSSAPVLDTTASFTVSAWADPSSLGTSNQTVVGQEGTQNSAFYLQFNYHSGQPGWALAFSNGDTAGPTFTTAYAAGATANTWTHLVGVYNASTHTAQLYVNGTLAATATGVTPWSATADLTVGRGLYDGNQTDYTNGSISDVQAYNYALNANQVSALYEQIP